MRGTYLESWTTGSIFMVIVLELVVIVTCVCVG
jgi:hypothetical protein